jgi:hypothetical protein
MTDEEKRRRRDGAGTYRRRPNGTFEVRTYDSEGKRRHATAHSVEEAERLLAAASMVFSKLPPNAARASSPTLKSLGEAWLDERELSGAHRAIATERAYWRTHIATAPFYETPLKLLQRKVIKQWVRELSKKNASRGHRQGSETYAMSDPHRRRDVVLS